MHFCLLRKENFNHFTGHENIHPNLFLSNCPIKQWLSPFDTTWPAHISHISKNHGKRATISISKGRQAFQPSLLAQCTLSLAQVQTHGECEECI